VDENPGISQEFEVMSIPSLIFFKDGKEVERLIGAHDKEEIIAKLEKLL
jgi:thioredoxin 1